MKKPKKASIWSKTPNEAKVVNVWAKDPTQLEDKEEPVKTPKKKKVGAKKAELDGIEFDSGLELYCYKALQEEGLEFEYTQTTFTVSPAFKYKGDCYEPDKRKGDGMYLKSNSLQSIKYTPDFVGDGWIIETKGRMNETFPMRWKLFKQYIMENGLNYDLYLPSNQKQVRECIKLIKSKNNQ